MLDTVIEHAADLLTVHAIDGTCRYASPAARALLGRAPEDLVGDGVFSIVVEEDAELVADAAREALREGTGGVTFRARRADGDVIWIEASLRAVQDALVVVSRDVTARRSAELALAHRALHDPLTGLPNRALFGDRLALALRRRARSGTGTVAVFFLDVDRFKLVNDSLGHEAGDALLLEVAARLEAAVRPSDTVARLAGDEFTVLCEEVAGELEAVAIAQRIVDLFLPPFVIGGREVHVSTSVGVALSSGRGGASAEALIRDADAAMYRAKERGKARFELYDATLRAHAVHRLELETELRGAVRRGELLVHYQPQIDLVSGEPVAYEALVRWEHPRRGLLAAAEFVPLAEESGLIVALGEHVLREACAEAARRSLPVCVNLAPRQLAAPDLPARVAATLESSGLEPELLCLEIGEAALTPERGVVLCALADLGVRLALDDFGAGSASLALLRDWPVEQVKLDRALLADDFEVLGAVVALARALGLEVVAEGVETPAQLAMLERAGCRRAQGFLLGEPEPVAVTLHAA
jgi:diguanylate cyclase (GGDEF)-like protein/PAS domain S-box-containing protein